MFQVDECVVYVDTQTIKQYWPELKIKKKLFQVIAPLISI